MNNSLKYNYVGTGEISIGNGGGSTEKKYKIGDKIRIKDKFWELETYDTPGIPTIMGKCAGMVLEVDRIYDDGDIETKQKEDCDIDTNWAWHHTWVEPVQKTLDDLEVGDVVVNRYKTEYKVIDCAKNNQIFFMETEHNAFYETIKFLKNNGYTLKQDTIVEKQSLSGKEVSVTLDGVTYTAVIK